jgi:hypothetical protein
MSYGYHTATPSGSPSTGRFERPQSSEGARALGFRALLSGPETADQGEKKADYGIIGKSWAGRKGSKVARESDAAIEEFLGDQPSSAQLRSWRETLLARAKRLREELKNADREQQSALRVRLKELDRQIAALEQEELVTEFVEDSVRVTLAMGSIADEQRMEE